MTREEAVNYLTLNKPSSGYPGLCEAIDMAIAALSTPAAPAQDDALVADGKKLLAMILGPCKQRLEHEWHKCKRCILMEELGHPGDSLAKRALRALLDAPVAAPPADLVVITDEQAKALDVIAATEDGIGQVADSIFAISNSDHIGWSEGGELRAHAMTLRDELAKVLAAYKVLYPLREAHELAEVPDER